MDDMRAWRESECAEDPTPYESMCACRHAGACARMAKRAGLADWYGPDLSGMGALACAMGCGGCHEWEG